MKYNKTQTRELGTICRGLIIIEIVGTWSETWLKHNAKGYIMYTYIPGTHSEEGLRNRPRSETNISSMGAPQKFPQQHSIWGDSLALISTYPQTICNVPRRLIRYGQENNNNYYLLKQLPSGQQQHQQPHPSVAFLFSSHDDECTRGNAMMTIRWPRSTTWIEWGQEKGERREGSVITTLPVYAPGM